jgi:protein-S-isoprenylcysteine O-methyltransferase Ste14
MTLDERGKMKKPLPPVYFLGAIILSIALHFLFPLRQIFDYPWRLVGFLPLVAGIVLNLLADQDFKKHKTTVKPFQKSSALVTAGVFGISRNPMYLGMTLILLGIASLLGSTAPFMVALLFPLLMDRSFIDVEEEMLEDTFGTQFREYRERVRRWI